MGSLEISEFKVENFKSIKNSGELEIDDLNVLIGKNDAGKSSLLEALQCFLEPPNQSDGKPDDGHFHKDRNEDIILEATFSQIPDSIRQQVNDDYSPDAELWTIKQVCERNNGKSPNWTIYFNGEALSGGEITVDGETLTQKREVRDHIWENFLPDPIWIPAERDITEDTKLKGGTVLTRLLKPILTKEGFDDGTLQSQVKNLEDSLESTVGRVGNKLTDRMQLHLSNLEEVEIDPGSVDVVKSIKPNVKIKDQYLDESVDISERGSGVGSLLYLSLMQTYVDMQVGEGYFLLFEEPGNFLHPAAERKMLSALRTIADEGQVAISTHSQTMIDRENTAKMHVVRRESGETEFELVNNDAFAAIDEIGARNSDLLQSDFVIYVEGATELKVLSEIAPRVVEDWEEYNIVIQPLGGTGNMVHCEPEQLKEINRNFAVLVDSDRAEESNNPSDIALEMKRKCERIGKKCKILEYSAIENYYSADAISAVCGIDVDESFVGKYDNVAENISEILFRERIPEEHRADMDEEKREEKKRKQFNKPTKGKEIVEWMYKNGYHDRMAEIEEFLHECVESAQ